MKASDIELGLIKVEEEGYQSYWKGFLIYMKTPVYEIIGNQLSGEYGDYVPLNFLPVEGEEIEQKKKADIGILNIKSFENKSGGFTFTMGGLVELFGMKFPMRGFISIKNEAKTVRIEFDDQSVDYYTSDIYYKSCANRKKEPVSLIIEDPTIDYTSEDLNTMAKAYPDFLAWYTKYIQSNKYKKLVSKVTMIQPKSAKKATNIVTEETPF